MSQKSEKVDLRQPARSLRRLLGEYRRTIAILTMVGVLSAIATGTIPIIIGSFLDSLANLDATTEVVGVTMPVWSALLILWVTAQIIASVTGWINDRGGRNLQIKLQLKYQSQGF
jgi:ABC-type multidrug transport system fused ATPase/permease subunit